MTVTRERFHEGMTFAEYKAQMTHNRKAMEDAETQIVLVAEDSGFFSGLSQPIYALVLTEDWCGAAIESVPVLACLAAQGSRLVVRIFLRDQNPDLMDLYLKDGIYRSIPTFVFFDEEFREVGRWTERAAKIEELMIEMERDLFDHDPAFEGLSVDAPYEDLPEEAKLRLDQAYEGFWLNYGDFSNREVAREIREVLARGLAADRGSRPSANAPGPLSDGAH